MFSITPMSMLTRRVKDSRRIVSGHRGGLHGSRPSVTNASPTVPKAPRPRSYPPEEFVLARLHDSSPLLLRRRCSNT
jgi:hypothetical protein